MLPCESNFVACRLDFRVSPPLIALHSVRELMNELQRPRFVHRARNPIRIHPNRFPHVRRPFQSTCRNSDTSIPVNVLRKPPPGGHVIIGHRSMNVVPRANPFPCIRGSFLRELFLGLASCHLAHDSISKELVNKQYSRTARFDASVCESRHNDQRSPDLWKKSCDRR